MHAIVINNKSASLLTAVVAMMSAALGAAPYEVAGSDTPKPHEQTAMKELPTYLGKRVAGTVRVGGKDGVVYFPRAGQGGIGYTICCLSFLVKWSRLDETDILDILSLVRGAVARGSA